MNSTVCIATSKNGGRDGGFEREMEERVKREMKEEGWREEYRLVIVTIKSLPLVPSSAYCIATSVVMYTLVTLLNFCIKSYRARPSLTLQKRFFWRVRNDLT